MISGPYTILYGSTPKLELLPWIIGIGVFAAIQQVAKTSAYRLAEASLLAPYSYTSIVWATIMGWIIWHDFPAIFVIAGTAVVIGCNLFGAWHESAKIRAVMQSD